MLACRIGCIWRHSVAATRSRRLSIARRSGVSWTAVRRHRGLAPEQLKPKACENMASEVTKSQEQKAGASHEQSPETTAAAAAQFLKLAESVRPSAISRAQYDEGRRLLESAEINPYNAPEMCRALEKFQMPHSG